MGDDCATPQEQQEKLRRFVDEWRDVVWESGADLSSPSSNPINLGLRQSDSSSDDPAPLIICSGSSAFQKLITVLSYDCAEIEKLRVQAHSEIFPRLLVFGQSTKERGEGAVQLEFANSYEFFFKLRSFLVSLRELLSNLVRQLQALYSPASRKKPGLSSFSALHLDTPFISLMQGLVVLVTLDEIVAHNGAIGHAMSLFNRMLQSVRSNPQRFSIKADQIEALDLAVTQMDDLLLTGLFQRCLQEDFPLHLEKEELKDNMVFLEELALCIRNGLSNILSRIDSSMEQPGDRENLLGLLGGFVMYSWMSGELFDKKTLKIVLKMITTLPVVHPISNVKLPSIEFILGHSPPWIRSSPLVKELRKESLLHKRAYLATLDDSLQRDLLETERNITRWLISFSSFSYSPHVANDLLLATLSQQVTLGILLANKLQCLVRSVVDLHVLLEVPISKELVKHCRHGMELLKAIQAAYKKMEHDLFQSLEHISSHLISLLWGVLLRLQAQMQSTISSKLKNSNMNLFNRSPSHSREPDTKLLDALSCVNVAMKALQAYSTPQAQSTLHLALELIHGLNGKAQDEFEAAKEHLLLLDLALRLPSVVDEVVDCSFLYWNKEMMPTCFSMAYSDADRAIRLQYLVSAFLDGAKLLRAGGIDQQAIVSYQNSIQSSLTSELIEPLCHDIETDLRLHVHSAQVKGAVTVNLTKTGVRDLSWFLKLRPLRLVSRCIDIKSRVEAYLNAAFYDHAAVALHDWKTYNRMKNLAQQKYGLVLDAIHLPGHTLEQGVDILEIMRNIHIFVACYTYNLNTQIFVEKPSNASSRKHLNTVSVKHVANSIRTHGTGIMSTTVNFAYQFLAQKFVVFSQFLFDDHIKSRLLREQRFYKEKKLRPDNGYPVARAEKLIKDIKKLGVTDDGSSFLDQFRCLIAEIGNALGFVRMVRLGGLHYCTTACGSVPDQTTSQSFEESAVNLHSAIDAGRLLDKALNTQKLSVDETDYFSILTNVFHQELRSNDNLHLRDFFLLVPALTVNAAESMLQAKEKLHKRGRDAINALFTDDGFPLGVAYILKVLGQDTQFNSLHWFPSAKSYFTSEKTRLESSLDMDSIGGGMEGLQAWSQKLASLSKEEAQNMQMAMKRLTSILIELELIEFTFTGARVFLR